MALDAFFVCFVFHVWLAYFMASVLVELVQDGARKRERMDALWAMIATAYDENGVDRNRITCLDE